MDTALRIVKYLKQQLGKRVLLSSQGDLAMSAHCDTDWASCPMSRKLLTDYLIKLGNSLITWKSKRSSTES